MAAGSIAGDQSLLTLEYVADPVTALLALDQLEPDAVLIPTDVVGILLSAMVSGVRQWAGVPVLVVLDMNTDAVTRAADAVAAGCSGLLSLPLTTAQVAVRLAQVGGQEVRGRARGVLNVAGLEVDLDGMRVSVDGERGATLSTLQFGALVRLARAHPSPVSMEDLADELGIGGADMIRRTRGVVVRLRRRLIELGCEPGVITHLRGRGYRLDGHHRLSQGA